MAMEELSEASSRSCCLRRTLTHLQIRSILPFLLQNPVLVSNPNHVKVFLVVSLFASENKPLLTGLQDSIDMSISLVTDCLSQMKHIYGAIFLGRGVII
ncbi:hypothetical protein K1719_042972 [Acacia pycnantha]|nr:hypothetical protein K1719_042972 [Acacia pycnantha]